MKSSTLASIYAMMALSIGGVPYIPEPEPLTKEEKERRKKKIDKDHGLREFTIDGITVMALNEKNAIKKVSKIKNHQ